MKRVLLLRQFEKLNNTSYCKSHTVSVLSICDIQSRSTTLNFARQYWKVHVVSSSEIGQVWRVAEQGLEFAELIIREHRSPEANGKVWLWTSGCNRDRIVPALVDAFDQDTKIFGAKCREGLWGGNE